MLILINIQTRMLIIYFSIEGCIRGLSINTVTLDLSDHTPSIFGNDPPLPEAGCTRENACLNPPCENSGVCVNSWEGPSCDCGPGFFGWNCSAGTLRTSLISSSISIPYDKNSR